MKKSCSKTSLRTILRCYWNYFQITKRKKMKKMKKMKKSYQKNFRHHRQ